MLTVVSRLPLGLLIRGAKARVRLWPGVFGVRAGTRGGHRGGCRSGV
jgi:hypothetical protein